MPSYSEAFQINVPKEIAWSFFNNLQELSSCIQDLEKIEIIDKDHFVAGLKTRIGIIPFSLVMNFEVVQRVEQSKMLLKGSGFLFKTGDNKRDDSIEMLLTLDMKENPTNQFSDVMYSIDVNASSSIKKIVEAVMKGKTRLYSKEFVRRAKEKLEPQVPTATVK